MEQGGGDPTLVLSGGHRTLRAGWQNRTRSPLRVMSSGLAADLVTVFRSPQTTPPPCVHSGRGSHIAARPGARMSL